MRNFGIEFVTDEISPLVSHVNTLDLTFDIELHHTISGTFPCDLHCGVIEVQLLGCY